MRETTGKRIVLARSIIMKEGEAATTARWVTFATPDIGGNVKVSGKVDYV